MMSTISAAPSLSELYKLIHQVPKYPFSNEQLINLASRLRAPKEVVDFYKSFGSEVYENEDDLTARTEQVDLMRQEERDMPREEGVASEDY